MTKQAEPSAIGYLRAGRGYLNAMSLLENALKQEPAKLGFSGSVLETLLGHGVELIFKAHFLILGHLEWGHNLDDFLSKILDSEYSNQVIDPALSYLRQTDFNYKKQQNDLMDRLKKILLEDLEEEYPLDDFSEPTTPNAIVVDNNIDDKLAKDTLIFHVQLLTMQMGKSPYPARYPLTGSYQQPNFEFVLSTMQSFANWLEPRCMDKYNKGDHLQKR